MSVRDRALLVIACLAAAIVGPYLLVIKPKRDQADKLQTQINAEQSQLDSARAELAAGNAARASFGRSYTALVRLGEAVPTDDDTPSLIYQLQAAAKATRVEFQSLTFNAGQGVGSSSPAAGPSSSTPGGSASSGTLPPGAVVGPAGFPIEPFTFTFQGSFFHLADFLGRLQRFVVSSNRHLSVSGRLMSLNGITLEQGSAGFPGITATITATAYLLPPSQGLLNGATPAGPAGSTTQTVSNPSPAGPVPPAVATVSPVR